MGAKIHREAENTDKCTALGWREPWHIIVVGQAWSIRRRDILASTSSIMLRKGAKPASSTRNSSARRQQEELGLQEQQHPEIMSHSRWHWAFASWWTSSEKCPAIWREASSAPPQRSPRNTPPRTSRAWTGRSWTRCRTHHIWASSTVLGSQCQRRSQEVRQILSGVHQEAQETRRAVNGAEGRHWSEAFLSHIQQTAQWTSQDRSRQSRVEESVGWNVTSACSCACKQELCTWRSHSDSTRTAFFGLSCGSLLEEASRLRSSPTTERISWEQVASYKSWLEA